MGDMLLSLKQSSNEFSGVSFLNSELYGYTTILQPYRVLNYSLVICYKDLKTGQKYRNAPLPEMDLNGFDLEGFNKVYIYNGLLNLLKRKNLKSLLMTKLSKSEVAMLNNLYSGTIQVYSGYHELAHEEFTKLLDGVKESLVNRNQT